LNKRLQSYFFLCTCLKPQQEPTEIHAIRKMIEDGSIHWERIIEWANRELITPALWNGLMQKGLQDAVPEDVAAYLSELHRLNRDRNRAIRRQIREITAALNRVNVEPLLLKGAALLFTDVLEDPAVRMMYDIDFMVRPEDLSLGLEVLRGLKYEHPAHDSSEFLFAAHAPPLCRTGDPASVEVHTRLFHQYNDPQVLTVSDIWQDAVSVTENGLAALVLSPSHAVVFNVVHSEIHHEHFDLGNIALKDLLDLVLMARLYATAVDWHAIHDRLADHGLATVGECYVYMGHKLLGCPVPPGFAMRAQNACHYARCLLGTGWPGVYSWVPVGGAIRISRLFSAERMQRRFGCSGSAWDLARTRIAYCGYLVRNFVFGAKRRMLLARLKGESLESDREITKD
jgi:hypothetical protein